MELKDYRPIQLNDLIRIGDHGDGGYILTERQLQATKILLSFGINDNWSFEEDFCNRQKPVLYGYDYSASPSNRFRKLIRMTLRNLANRMIKLPRCSNPYHDSSRPHAGKLQSARKVLRDTPRRLKTFFSEKDNRHFIAKYLGAADDRITTSLPTIFKALGELDDQSVFIKMDIEGSEYDVLPQLAPYLSKVNGLCIEFHDLHLIKYRQAFEQAIAMLSKEFHIAHVHGNNACGELFPHDLPPASEFTFIHRKLVAESVELSNAKYPIANLDSPNIAGRSDIELNF